MTFDDEAMAYIAFAAESRIRSLLSSSIAAQTHRVSSSHFREPPFQPRFSSSSRAEKPMWSHRVTSDDNAVLDALSRANKEAEQSFRASRMDRLARETEIQRAQKPEPADPSTTVEADSFGVSQNGPPVFGAVSEKKGTKKAGKKAGRDVSVEVQHKMSNAAAMHSVGMLRKKQYSWLTSMPNVSSPLSGKKRKAGKEEVLAGTTSEGEPGDGREKGKVQGKEGGPGPDGVSLSPKEEEGERPIKRTRGNLLLSVPTRRMVLVDRDARGQGKRIQDDRVVTMMDLLFALERDGLGKGMGMADEIVRRVWATGGIWKDGADEGRGQ